MVLTKDMPAAPESRGQRTPVRGPEDMERALGAKQGELFNMCPPNANSATQAWHQARVALASDLVIITDPDEPEVCWLALRPERGQLEPLLLHRLPWTLYDHPATKRPDNEPF